VCEYGLLGIGRAGNEKKREEERKKNAVRRIK
jgi:hypothetical protein